MKHIAEETKNEILVGDRVAVVVCLYKKRFPVSVLIDRADAAEVGRNRWFVNFVRGKLYATSGRGRMHRILSGAKGKEITDHANRRGTDNRRGNLRATSQSLNCGNSVGKGARSGYKGVYRSGHGRDKYQAKIMFQGKTISLGEHFDPAEAAKAYDRKAIEIFGQFAHTNFPRSDYE